MWFRLLASSFNSLPLPPRSYSGRVFVFVSFHTREHLDLALVDRFPSFVFKDGDAQNAYIPLERGEKNDYVCLVGIIGMTRWRYSGLFRSRLVCE